LFYTWQRNIPSLSPRWVAKVFNDSRFSSEEKVTDILLKTKFYIPPTRPEIVSRERLINQLNEGLHRKLTLISAPTGFGKTTLVTDWLDNLQGDVKNETQAKSKITWLSLDKKDSDPARFLTYLVAAL
jgi:LuxR family transcriptional regulator, maltose regulon positive regulatory protein